MKFINQTVKKYKSILKSQKQRALLRNSIAAVVVLVVAVIGVKYLIDSYAASPYTSVNANAGALNGDASIVNNSNASDGHVVQFGVAPNTALAVHVDGTQLVNGQGSPIRLLGVDVTGTETQCIKVKNAGFSLGASGTIAQDQASAAAMLAWHINAVRIPLNEDCWLGINGAPAAYSGTNYRTAIENWVQTLNNAGIITILDLHWVAPGTNKANQQWPMPDYDHAPAFWTSVASTFKSDPAVIFDPFNEPFLGGGHPTAADWSCWLTGSISGNINSCPTVFTPAGSTQAITYATAGMQLLVNTIRATGASQPIMVGGLNWAGDPCGLKNSTGSTTSSLNDGGTASYCSEIANMPKDPDNQLAISVHIYGPTHNTACAASSCWQAMESAAKMANLPIITGELGEQNCQDNWLNSYMDWADQNDVSYLAWTWTVTAATSCSNWVSPSDNGSANTQLLSSWRGIPSTLAPQAADFRAHLISQNP
jgi:hypothetical protein